LMFLLRLSTVHRAMSYVEKDIPWGEIASFHTSAKSDDIDSRIEDRRFPQPEKGVGRPTRRLCYSRPNLESGLLP
jgi:hypothetical protein